MEPQTYLPIALTDTEMQDLHDLARANRSFYEVWKSKRDLTQSFINELMGILHGKIPRNFVINIKGNIGRLTGIFKTSLGSQLALLLDPSFNVKERVAFTPNELLDKIKQYATRKQIFLLDEQVHDFKMSAEQSLANIIEACRERQLCFILCGVAEQHLTFSDYHLERMGESSDDHINATVKVNGEDALTGKKTVYYLVRKITENKRTYRGYIKWNIISLEDERWRKYWEEYMVLKRIHEQNAVEQSLTGFNFKKEAQRVIDSEAFRNCYDASGRLIKAKVANLVYEMYPDRTKEEKRMIQVEIQYPDAEEKM